eukprot:2393172-Amphidinium_carterae.1
MSETQGLADPSTTGTVIYEPTITTMYPTSGSMVGGTLVVMEGWSCGESTTSISPVVQSFGCTPRGDGLAGLTCATIMVGGSPCLEPSTMGITLAANQSGVTELPSTLHPTAPRMSH